MLSANGSDGKLYVSGSVDDPKSRDYTCPHPNCGMPVSHVSEHERSLSSVVREHFRHPADASHPIKRYNWQIGDAVNSLQASFRELEGYDLAVDRFFTDPVSGAEYYAEMSIRDKVLGRTAVVRVESEQFKADEFHAMLRHLSSQNLYTMLLLSACGVENSAGKYFRDYQSETHPDRVGLKKISGNERAVADLLGELAYFNHDEQVFFRSGFTNYVEDQKYNHRTGKYEEGETEYTTIQIPEATAGSKCIVPVFMDFSNGLKVARMRAVNNTEKNALNSLYRVKNAINSKAEDAKDVLETECEQFAIITEDLPDENYVVRVYNNLIGKTA